MTIKDLAKLFLWDIINPLLLWLKKKRKIKISDEIHGVNIGCGIDNPPKWLGIDGGATHYMFKLFPKFVLYLLFKGFNMSKNYAFIDYFKKIKKVKIIHHDLRYGLPFTDNSVANIYSSHLLEHLFYPDAEKLINECYRILKNGGYIRICVPSLEKEVEGIKYALKEYENGNIEPIQKYLTSDKVGYISSYSIHRQMYNYEKLFQILSNSGFKKIKKCDFKSGEILDVELLDNRINSLYLEGVKQLN